MRAVTLVGQHEPLEGERTAACHAGADGTGIHTLHVSVLYLCGTHGKHTATSNTCRTAASLETGMSHSGRARRMHHRCPRLWCAQNITCQHVAGQHFCFLPATCNTMIAKGAALRPL